MRKLRVFLFQLLCVLGQWQRALTQLQVCGELDAGTLAMVNTYRDALQCEAVREAVFAGKTTPMVFGQPQTWVALLVEALQVDARGDAAGCRTPARRRPSTQRRPRRAASTARPSTGSPMPTRASARCSKR